MNKQLITDLKENDIFQASDETEISYMHQAAEYDELEKRYRLSSIVGEGDLEKALDLLKWVNGHIHHSGGYDNSDRQDALTLLELAFDKDYGINCLAMSIVLCECLLAVNIKARVMYMMPKSTEDGDNHVVVEAFVSDLNKWIMLDPTYGSYCLDSDDRILNLYEIRRLLAREEEIFFSNTINYNGAAVDDFEDVKEYYAKNLFFLRCKSVQGYGQHIGYGNILEIAPQGFDVHKRMTKNLQFRIKEYGDCEVFQRWLNYEKELKNKYIAIGSIY